MKVVVELFMDKSLFKSITAKELHLNVSLKDATSNTIIIKGYGDTKQKITINNLHLNAKTVHPLSKPFILYNFIWNGYTIYNILKKLNKLTQTHLLLKYTFVKHAIINFIILLFYKHMWWKTILLLIGKLIRNILNK